MSYRVVRSEEEIDDVLDDCLKAEDDGSRFPGASYESGVRYAIEWLIGLGDTHPLDE